MSYAQSPPLVQDEWFTDPVPADAPLRHPDVRAGRRRPEPRTATVRPPRSFGGGGHHEVAARPSLGRRFFRAAARFVIFVSIGVGGTIAAQTDVAKELLAAQAPTFAWMLSVAPTKSPGAAAPAQQVESLAFGLDAVRRSVEQLAARQDQMVQNVAALQVVDDDIRQKLSSMPAPLPQPAAAVPQPRSPQVRAPSSAAQSAAPRLAPGAQTPLPAR